MNQPNQSELDGLLSELGIGMCKFKPDSDSSPGSVKCYYCGGSEWKPQHTARATIVNYITANYTPNSTVESLNSQIAWLDGKVEEMREEVAERAKLKEDDVSKLDWTLPELNQLMAYCQWAENEGAYYGNKSQFLNRHTAIVVKLGSMIGEKTPHKPLGKDK